MNAIAGSCTIGSTLSRQDRQKGNTAMSTIRIATLSALLVIVIALAAFFAVGAWSATPQTVVANAAAPNVPVAAQATAASCPRFEASMLSTQELRDLLNARLDWGPGHHR